MSGTTVAAIGSAVLSGIKTGTNYAVGVGVANTSNAVWNYLAYVDSSGLFGTCILTRYDGVIWLYSYSNGTATTSKVAYQ